MGTVVVMNMLVSMAGETALSCITTSGIHSSCVVSASKYARGDQTVAARNLVYCNSARALDLWVEIGAQTRSSKH